MYQQVRRHGNRHDERERKEFNYSAKDDGRESVILQIDGRNSTNSRQYRVPESTNRWSQQSTNYLEEKPVLSFSLFQKILQLLSIHRLLTPPGGKGLGIFFFSFSRLFLFSFIAPLSQGQQVVRRIHKFFLLIIYFLRITGRRVSFLKTKNDVALAFTGSSDVHLFCCLDNCVYCSTRHFFV